MTFNSKTVNVFVQYINDEANRGIVDLTLVPKSGIPLELSLIIPLSNQLNKIIDILDAPFTVENSCIQIKDTGSYPIIDMALGDQESEFLTIRNKAPHLILRTKLSVRARNFLDSLLLCSSQAEATSSISMLKKMFEKDADFIDYFVNSGCTLEMINITHTFPKTTTDILNLFFQMCTFVTGIEGLLSDREILKWIYSSLKTSVSGDISLIFKLYMVIITYKNDDSSIIFKSIKSYDKGKERKPFMNFIFILKNSKDNNVLFEILSLINIFLLTTKSRKTFYEITDSLELLGISSEIDKLRKIGVKKIVDECNKYDESLNIEDAKADEAEISIEVGSKEGKQKKTTQSKRPSFTPSKKKLRNSKSIENSANQVDTGVTEFYNSLSLGGFNFEELVNNPSDDEDNIFAGKKVLSQMGTINVKESTQSKGKIPLAPPPPQGISIPGPPPPAAPPSSKKSSNDTELNNPAYLQIFWNKITSNDIKQNINRTVWGQQIPKFYFNTDELKENFEVKKTAITRVSTPKIKSKSIIEKNKSQTIAIVLKKFPSEDFIITTIDNMDYKSLDVDSIRQIQAMLPDEQETKLLNKYNEKNAVSKLGNVEKFLIKLISIPQVQDRLKLLTYINECFNIENDNSVWIFNLLNAINQLLESELLKIILKLVYEIGNTLNRVKTEFGFKIDFLEKCSSINDIKNKKNLVYHVCNIIIDNAPDFGDLYSELGSVHSCCRFDFEFLNDSIETHNTKYIEYMDLCKAVNRNVTNASVAKHLNQTMLIILKRITYVRLINRRIRNRFKKMLQFYGYTYEESKDVIINQFFKTISTFSSEYKIQYNKICIEQENLKIKTLRRKKTLKHISDVNKLKTSEPKVQLKSTSSAETKIDDDVTKLLNIVENEQKKFHESKISSKIRRKVESKTARRKSIRSRTRTVKRNDLDLLKELVEDDK